MLRISEIFYSLQGETRTSGFPTLFIRLTGCPLRCSYCDSDYAFTGGDWMTQEQILSRVDAIRPAYVTVTGGEPLAQPAVLSLLSALCDRGAEVSLETSGAYELSQVDPRVVRVVDWKTPDSGEARRNRYELVRDLRPGDSLKLVLCSRRDYDWAKLHLQLYQVPAGVEVLFSPCHGQLAPRELAEWILADRLPVRLQLQLHKLLWNDQPGH